MTPETPDRRALFDEWAARFDTQVQRTGKDESPAARCPFPFDGYDEVLAAVIDAADLSGDLEVLDLGIGTGNLTRLGLDRAPRSQWWGIDFSEKMLEEAREKVPEATLVAGDLRFEWPEEIVRKYDRILSTYVFHEFPPHRKIQMANRLFDDHLRPGGFLVIGDIGFPTTEIHDHAHELWKRAWDEGEHYWQADVAEPAFREAGFTLRFQQVSSCATVAVVTRGGSAPEG